MSSPPDAQRGRVGVAILLGVVGALLLWGVATAWSLAGAAGDLRTARSELVAAEAALRDARLADARVRLADGVDHARAASTELHRLWLRPWRIVPVAGPNLRAVTALSDAARDGGDAAVELLATADTIVRDDREQPHGEISLDYLGDLRAPVRRVADALGAGVAEVATVDGDALLSPVADQRDAFLRLAAPAAEQAEVGATLLEAMPTFLGETAPRRYLVGAMSLSELRATGGLFGSWTVLTTDRGRLVFDDFSPVDELPDLAEDVASPSLDHERRYGPLGGLRIWRNVNLTPDLEATATSAMALWEAGGREPLDGVVLLDPVTFSRLVDLTGGIEVEGVTTLAPGEALEFLTLTAYAAFDDDDERKRVLGGAATVSLASLLDAIEDDDVPGTVELLAGLAAGDHVRVHVRDAEVQAAFDRAGVGQVLPTDPGEFTAVAVNNVAGNKVDVFTHRRVEQDVRLLDDGVVETRTTVTFVNQAPREGYPRHVLGPWAADLEAGDNLSEVTLVCGVGCEVAEHPADGRVEGFVRGLPAADVRVHVPAGEERELVWVTRTPGAWSRQPDGTTELRLRHWLQPTVEPTHLDVRVALPDGAAVRSSPADAEVVGDELRWSWQGSGSVELPVRLAGSPPSEVAAPAEVTAGDPPG